MSYFRMPWVASMMRRQRRKMDYWTRRGKRHERRTMAAYYKKRRSAKRRRYPKTRKWRRYTRRKTLPAVARDVALLKRTVSAMRSKWTTKERDAGQLLCTGRDTSYHEVSMLNVTICNQIVDATPYYDSSTNAMTTKNLAAASQFSLKMHFAFVQTSMTAKNNYEIPVICQIYVVIPRSDTGILPMTMVHDGLTDLGVTGTPSQVMTYPSDSHIFRENWKIVRYKKAELKPGDSLYCSYRPKPFVFDPSSVDTHTIEFQKHLGAHVFILRIEGTLGHDDAAGYGRTAGGVDWENNRKVVLKYDGGLEFERMTVLDTSEALSTTTGVASVMPASEQQAFTT